MANWTEIPELCEETPEAHAGRVAHMRDQGKDVSSLQDRDRYRIKHNRARRVGDSYDWDDIPQSWDVYCGTIMICSSWKSRSRAQAFIEARCSA